MAEWSGRRHDIEATLSSHNGRCKLALDGLDHCLAMFQRYLAPGGYLALVENIPTRPPWADEIEPVLATYSMNKDFQPYDNLSLSGDLQERHLFEMVGRRSTGPTIFRQHMNEYVTSFFRQEWMFKRENGRCQSIRVWPPDVL